MPAYQIILLACLGAFIQELCHWYNLRRKLYQKSYRYILVSYSYWIITLLMIIVSGVGTYFVFEGTENLKSLHYILCGAAFPALFTKLVGSFMGPKSDHVDPKSEAHEQLREQLNPASETEPAKPNNFSDIVKVFFST